MLLRWYLLHGAFAKKVTLMQFSVHKFWIWKVFSELFSIEYTRRHVLIATMTVFIHISRWSERKSIKLGWELAIGEITKFGVRSADGTSPWHYPSCIVWSSDTLKHLNLMMMLLLFFYHYSFIELLQLIYMKT